MAKHWVLLLVCVLSLSLSVSMFVGCDSVLNDDTTTDTGQTDDGSATIDSGSDSDVDGTSATSADNGTTHDADDDSTWAETDVADITLNGDSITTASTAVTIDGTTATITAAGTYRITGTLTDGAILVNTKDEALVRLILNGVSITCSTNSPLAITKGETVAIVLNDGTQNTLTDAATYVFADPEDDEPNAALYSKANLTISGSGSLTVDGNYNDGIASKDGLIIESGTINVTAADDGIRGKDYLVVKSGTITVVSGGDGLKSDNDEDATLGTIAITAGTLNITAGGDGLAAETDLLVDGGTISVTCGGGSNAILAEDASAKGLKAGVALVVDHGAIAVDAADDAVHSNGTLAINGGTFTIASGDDAVHAETDLTINGGTINVSTCYEGIEGTTIVINGGAISIDCTDDGLNATTGNGGEFSDGSCLTINGGTVAVSTSGGDGIDSNGNVVIAGGTVLVHGPQSNVEVALDFNGTFQVTGGVFIATGPNAGRMIQTPSASSTRYCVKATATSILPASTLFHVQDSSGNGILTFKPERSTYYIVFSSSALKTGETYSIYTGGSSTGTNTQGLYTDGTYSGGSLRKSFAISGTITSVSF